MSETKLATKADLKEMYDRMFPYLGGMPEMLANKFSKGDLYSTDEKMIGQWVDGKPLYQRTFEVGYLANNGITQVDITTLMNTVDTIADLQGIAVNESNKSVRPLCFADGVSSTNNIRMDVTYENNSYNLRVVTATNWGENTYKVYATLKYTKSTDSPISIGDANDYSTDEKVVGTWIDGKPLYQKTVGITITGTNEDYTHSIADIDKVIIKDAGLFDAVGNYLPNGFRNATGATFFSCYTNATYIHAITVSDYIGLSGYVTLQYTKTTD